MLGVHLNKQALGPRFIVTWAPRQGVIVVGRVIPFGIGTLIGGSAKCLSASYLAWGAAAIAGAGHTGTMRRLSEWSYERATWTRAGIASAVFAFFLWGPLRWQSARTEQYAGDEGAPDTRLWYSPNVLHDAAERFGPEGRRSYVVSRATFDVVWPVVYATSLTTVLSVLLRDSAPSGTRRRMANVLPWVGFAFDMAENVAVSTVMVRHPEPTPAVERIAPVMTLAKWVAVGTSTALVVALPCGTAARRGWSALRSRT